MILLAKRLSNPLQVGHLQRLFTELNPFIDINLVDWEAVLDRRLTYGENTEAFQKAYPQYKWVKEDDFKTYYLNDLDNQLSDIGYTAINELTLKRLENK